MFQVSYYITPETWEKIGNKRPKISNEYFRKKKELLRKIEKTDTQLRPLLQKELIELKKKYGVIFESCNWDSNIIFRIELNLNKEEMMIK